MFAFQNKGFNVYMEEAGNDGAAAGGAGAAESQPAKEEAKSQGVPNLGEPSTNGPDNKQPAAEDTNANSEAELAWQGVMDGYAKDNPALKVAFNWLKDAGFTPQSPAFVLADREGDFSLLKAELAAKGVQGAEEMVSILEGAAQAHFKAIEEHEARTTQIVGEIMGEDQEAILEWARSTADDDERHAFNEMFEAGGVYARAAAILLRSTYLEQSGVTKAASNPVQRSNNAPSAAGALTAREYAQEVDKLYHEVKGDPRNHPKYAELTRRREMGRRRGI